MTTHPTSPPAHRPPRRRRRAIADPRRFAPIAATAVAALVAGLVVGARHVPSERKAVASFASGWQRADYSAMYATLSDAARRRTSLARLKRTYEQAADVLTLTKLTTGRPREHGAVVDVPVVMQTRIFGRLAGTLTVPTGDREQGGAGVDWSAQLVYPGLRRGEKLRRETDLPPRAAIEARDGTALAKGPDRASASWPPTSPGASGPRRPRRPRSSRRAACPTAPRSASRGSNASSTSA
jgi:peptidoglycan glycosyltransferase